MDHLRLLPIRATVLPSYGPGPQLGVGLALLGDRLVPGLAAPLLNVLGSSSEASIDLSNLTVVGLYTRNGFVTTVRLL